jgi:hypothetical protein
MKNSISTIMAVWLTVTLSVLTGGNAFSQTGQENGANAAGDKTGTTHVTGLTAARAKSLMGVAVGLISLTIGWRVKKHRPVQSGRRTWAMIALGLGLVAIILGVVHLAGNTGGFGTGGGKAGAIVALIVGLTGAVMNGLALRSKRNITA